MQIPFQVWASLKTPMSISKALLFSSVKAAVVEKKYKNKFEV